MKRFSLAHLRLALGLLTGVMLWLLWQASTVTTPEIESVKLRYMICEALFGAKSIPDPFVGPEYMVIDNWRGFFPLALLFGVIFAITKPLARFVLLIVCTVLGAAAVLYWFHAVKVIVPLGGPALLLGCAYLCGSLIYLEVERIERNRNLAQDLLNYAELARQKIAKDLHDETLPMLSRTLRLVDEMQKKHQDDSLPGEMRAKLESTIAELRRIIDNLHPAALEHLGLGPSIEMLVDGCNRHTGVNTKCTINGDLTSLTKLQQLCVYRIVQEALTNVERHANASTCEVTLDSKGDGLAVRICDDGIGGAREKVASLGIKNIADRAQAIGGTVRWLKPESFASGTRLEVFIPRQRETELPVANAEIVQQPQT